MCRLQRDIVTKTIAFGSLESQKGELEASMDQMMSLNLQLVFLLTEAFPDRFSE